MTLELIQGLLLSFALVVILMPPYVRLLRYLGFAKQIREEGPQSHMVKWGTPTMGGLLMIAVVLAIFIVLRWPVQGGVIAPLATLAFVGLLGAADDYLNARTGEGIRARQKLLWQVVVAFAAAWQIQGTYNLTGIASRSWATSPWSPGCTSRSRRSPSSPRPTASISPTGSTASPAGRSWSPTRRS